MNSRLAYAELVRHFLSGRMTNHDYEELCDKFLNEGDCAVTQVYCRLWNNYCDVREHRMGLRHGMTREGRRVAGRWIMFLRSGRPYEYPTPGCLISLLSILTLGVVRRIWDASQDLGEEEVWPYFRRTDYESDLARLTYLAGVSAADQIVRHSSPI